jgi:hypothetical protein
MASDSLALSNYMIVARLITARVEPRIGGQKLVSAHTPPKYTPKGEIMLLEQLRKEREAL